MKRFIISIFLIAIMLFSLTGCDAKDKLELLNALEKSSKIYSFEGHSKLWFNDVSLDTNIDELEEFQAFIPMINSLSLEASQKMKQNLKRTATESETDMQVKLGDMIENTKVWSTMDLTQNPVVMKQIVRLPETAQATLPPELQGKPYLIMDQAALGGMDAVDLSEYESIMDSANDIQTQLLDMIKGYALEYDPDFAIVSQQPDQVINGKRHSAYQLKISDQSLKGLIQYLLNKLPDNEEAKGFFTDFLIASIGMMEGTEANEDLDSALENLRDGTTSFKEDLQRLSLALEDVTMLGSQGIEINFLINEEGYIVRQSGVIDLYIDTQQVEDALEKLASDNNTKDTAEGPEYYKAVFHLSLSFDSSLSRINEDITIDYPELTAENSFSLDDIFNLPSNNTTIKKGPGSGKAIEVNGTAVKSTVYPVRLGEHLFIPLKPTCEALKMNCVLADNGRFAVSNGEVKAIGDQNSRVIIVNGKKVELALPAMMIEGEIFVTDEFFTRCLGRKIAYVSSDGTLEASAHKNR